MSKSQIKTVSFWVNFQVKNLGDRGTTITDVDLTFKDSLKKDDHFRKSHFRLGEAYIQENRIWLNAHETQDIGADFHVTSFEGNDKEQIDCTFIIYHTHDSEEVKAISQKRSD